MRLKKVKFNKILFNMICYIRKFLNLSINSNEWLLVLIFLLLNFFGTIYPAYSLYNFSWNNMIFAVYDWDNWQGTDLPQKHMIIMFQNANYEFYESYSETPIIELGSYTASGDSAYITIIESNAPKSNNRIGLSFPITIIPFDYSHWVLTNAETLTCGWTEQDTLIIEGAYTSVSNNEKAVQNNLILDQNYPNPFNPKTTIPLLLTEQSSVKVDIYSINGQKVRSFDYESLNPGKHEIVFNGTELSSGIYFYTVRTKSALKTGRMLLIK